MNELEREIEYLIGWYGIKRKYNFGIAFTVIGILIVIIKLILLREFFPNYIAYHHDILVYNGPSIRLYIGIIMGSMGSSFLMIGLPLLIIYTKKKNRL
ncbi:MAG: hypothetical protein ACXAC5_19810 [Promethearchaeota archaeon]|jgi:hypothetical protein